MTVLWIIVVSLWILVSYNVLILGKAKRPSGDYKSIFSPTVHKEGEELWLEFSIDPENIEESTQFRREFPVGKAVEYEKNKYRIHNIEEEKGADGTTIMKVHLLKGKVRRK